MLINLACPERTTDQKNFYSLEGRRILIVDHNADNCFLISVILASYGVQVITAASAIKALKLMEKFEPHFLIADLVIPEIDGYSLIRQIRSLDSTLSKIPAIAVTALSTENAQAQAIKSGFQSCLLKPVDPDVLVAEVVRLVDERLVSGCSHR